MKHVTCGQGNSSELIQIAANVLKEGGLVIFPTDTVYGMLVDATNEKAVQKLILLKNRPVGKPVSVFISDFLMLQDQVVVTSKQLQILKELLPGPFTVILASKHKVSPMLESEKGTLGIRIPDYKLINQLIRKFGKPISATSANLSGRPVHYSITSLLRELPETKKQLIDLIIDSGDLPRNKPSTVVDLTAPQIKIVRQGDIVFNNENKYISTSPEQTQKIAQFVFSKVGNRHVCSLQKPLVFIIEGEVGVGKTVFAKGLGAYLGIYNIVSPTYVIFYEYASTKHLIKSFIHVDLYNIREAEEFKYLHLEKYLNKENVLCFEWGEKAGEIMNQLKSKGNIIFVKMKYKDEKTRIITVNY